MEGLAGLLDAARASTPGEDLAGERAAVAGFLAARQRAVPTAPPRRKNREARTFAMTVALGFAVLTFGGTALAARTGSLPPAAQERAHALFSGVGVPPPPAPVPATSAPPTTGRAVPSPTPAPSRTATPAPSATAATELCRVWDAAGQDPPGRDVPAEVRRSLAAAAGGVPRIDGFCAALLGEASRSSSAGAPASSGTPPGPGKPAGKPSAPGKPTVTPSHPGKGNGHTKK
ncbi:hypothetical protein [Actinoplanes nipponensis]|nr:hypothetical protein [Actinoplanes nipponensis]